MWAMDKQERNPDKEIWCIGLIKDWLDRQSQIVGVRSCSVNAPYGLNQQDNYGCPELLPDALDVRKNEPTKSIIEITSIENRFINSYLFDGGE